MNWKKRLALCKIQVYANNTFIDTYRSGVRVKNETGEVEYLNAHPMTDWDNELAIAKSKT